MVGLGVLRTLVTARGTLGGRRRTESPELAEAVVRLGVLVAAVALLLSVRLVTLRRPRLVGNAAAAVVAWGVDAVRRGRPDEQQRGRVLLRGDPERGGDGRGGILGVLRTDAL